MSNALHPFRKYERKPFDAARCTACGQCLSECPVMRLPEADAKQHFAALVAHWTDGTPLSRKTEKVLRDCTSCFACNLVCPEDCRPTNLFLDIWHRQYQREGLPVRARYFLPHSEPNFRTRAVARFPADQRAAIESWKRLDPAEKVFYPGCNIVASPYLTFSKLFDGLEIRGGLEYCCGEMYFRMGLYEQVEQVAAKLTRYFRRLGVKRVYASCTACLNVLSHVLPQFGADFSGIEFVSFVKLLHDRLASGALRISNPLNHVTVTVQDSCHAKIYEEACYDWPRRILELIGCAIVEAPRNRQRAHCCGIGAGFSHEAGYAKFDIISGQRACAANLRASGAQRIAVYCSGCLQTQSAAKYVSRTPQPVYHVIELVQEAIGEKPARRHRKLAFDLLAGTLLRQEMGKARFYVPPIE